MKAIIIVLAALVVIGAAYWLGASHEHLPTCNPWLDGCTSISSTGRYPPGDRLFRATLLPQAALLLLTWYFASQWLRAQQPGTRIDRFLLPMGLIGAVALVTYVYYLTSKDPFYEIMKTWGIYFYFAGTALCQVAVSVAMPASRLRQGMVWLCVTPFVLGVAHLVVKATLTDINSIENRVEWIVSLLMQLWFVVLYVAWRRTGFGIAVTAR